MNSELTSKQSLFKRITSFLVILCMMCGIIVPLMPVTAHAATADEHTTRGTRISNNYLVATASSEGRLALYTTGGDPDKTSDNNVRLLYGSLESGTSRAFVNINGSTRAHYGTPYITPDGDSIYFANTYSGVKVECYISFAYNTYTQRYDTVEYKYVFTNVSSDTKTAGVRIFFDTMLASNDSAPFRVSGENVTTHRTYTGDAIPQVWQVFDKYNNSSVVASGTLYNDITERPDKVQFLSYGNGMNEIWNCTGSGTIGDSAVNVYFNPTTLQPNESRTVKTYYGLSQFIEDEEDVEDEEASLDITALAPAELLANDDNTAYLGNPFTFNGGIKNNGNATAKNVVAVITLPDGLSVENNTLNLGNISAGSVATAFWSITADPRESSETLEYSVTYYADGIEPRTANYAICLPALDHNFVETSRTEATCTTDGRINYECSCGETRVEIIEAHGHNIETTVETEVTCTSDGLIVDRCLNDGCDYEKHTVIHGEHNYQVTDRQDAACEEQGYTEYTCSNCGDKNYEYFDGRHNYVETSRVEAQVGVDGSIIYTCTECGDSYSVAIPALNPVLKNSAVLLIQNSLPWAEDVNTSLLETLQGRGVVSYYNIINTSAIASTDLTQYGVVFIANDQTTSMYNGLAANAEVLENYVRAGGNLIYGACDEGWGGCGSLTHELPGGVETSNYYSVHNYIVNGLHPIVTGVYTDNRSLADELLKGNYCSHTYFVKNSLPEGTDIILRDANGNPTLVEYSLGDGTVIASGLTWEYFYVRNHYDMVTNYSKYAYDDLVTYMVYMSNTCEHNYEMIEVVEPTCEENGYTLYVCSVCSHEYKGDIVVAPGHDFVEVSRTEGNCSVMGEIVYNCHCGEVKTEQTGYGDHISSDWIVDTAATCVPGSQHKECTVCEEILETEAIAPVAEHIASDWIVDVAPTATQTGSRHKECTVCHTVLETEVMEVLAKLVIANVEAKAGHTVRVTIDVQNNPGIIGAVLTINYDSALTLVGVEAGSAWSTLNFTRPAVLSNPCNFVWDGINDADFSDGTIIVLTFQLPEVADVGTVWGISASYTYGNLVNADLDTVDMEIEDGSITVINSIGDVNDDGVVDVADVIVLRRYLAGGYGVSIDETAADMNADGIVTVVDVILLRQLLTN